MKNLMLSFISGCLLVAGLLFPAFALADQTGAISDPACNAVVQQNKIIANQNQGKPADQQQPLQSLAGCTSGQKTGLADPGGPLATLIEAVVFVAGILAVVFIIVGGINFIGSTGDPARIVRAKNSVQYAVIGLIIAILAQLIVSFVIGGVHS